MNKIKLVWNKFWSIFDIMARLSFSFIGKPKKVDTGLRGTFGGRLYVDKKVFYKRPEVIATIESIKNSVEIREEIDNNRAPAKLKDSAI